MTDGGKAALRLDLALICSIGFFPLIARSNLYVKKWPPYSCVIFHGAVVKVLFSQVNFLTLTWVI